MRRNTSIADHIIAEGRIQFLRDSSLYPQIIKVTPEHKVSHTYLDIYVHIQIEEHHLQKFAFFNHEAIFSYEKYRIQLHINTLIWYLDRNTQGACPSRTVLDTFLFKSKYKVRFSCFP